MSTCQNLFHFETSHYLQIDCCSINTDAEIVLCLSSSYSGRPSRYSFLTPSLVRTSQYGLSLSTA